MTKTGNALTRRGGGSDVAFAFAKIERVTLSAQIIAQIKEKILSGGFGDGDKLPSERVLAEAFQVSRPAVREALKALEYIGIIEARPGEGAFVRGDLEVLNSHLHFARVLRRYSLEEMMETRRVVEAATVRLAIERGSAEDLEALTAVYQSSLKLMDHPQAFLDADFRFHQSIAEMAGNSILLEVFTAMREMTLSMNKDVIRSPGQTKVVEDYHRQILEAITLRDADAAHTAMEAHLNNALKTLNSILDTENIKNT